MNKFLDSVKRFGRQLRGLFPSALPVGMTEFEAWIQDLMETYSLPTSRISDVKWICSTNITSFGPTVAVKSKFYFVLVIRAAAAKQVAGAVFVDIKEQQKKQYEEEQRKNAEATALSAVASDVKSVQN